MDVLSSVPEEVSEIILSYLPFKDLATAASVSRKWRSICDSLNQHGMRCCAHKKFLDQPVVSDFSGEESGCRWIELYNASCQRARNWRSNEFSTIHIDRSIFIHGFVVFTGSVNSLSINRVKNGELDIIQKIEVPLATVTRISVSGDTLVFGNDLYLYIFKLHRTYEKEAILCPIKGKLVSQAENDVPTEHFYKISVITKNHIWIRIKTIHEIIYDVSYNETHVCQIFNRNDRTFIDIPFDCSLCEIHNNDEFVSILLWNSIHVYKTSGELLKTLDSSLIYKDLSMTSEKLAFIQWTDFSKPQIVNYDLKTENFESKHVSKVYKMLLYESILFFLTGDSGPKVLRREGKWASRVNLEYVSTPILQVVANKFVLVCLSDYPIGKFSLYDIDNGHHLYISSLSDFSSDLIRVFDSGLVYYEFSEVIPTLKFRSYI